MSEDPIVTEVRQAGQVLAERAEGDLHRFFEQLREAQKQYSDRVIQPPPRPSEPAFSAPNSRGAREE